MASTIWDDFPGIALDFKSFNYKQLLRQVTGLPKGRVRTFSGAFIGTGVEMVSNKPFRFRQIPIYEIVDEGEPSEELVSKAVLFLHSWLYLENIEQGVIKVATQAEVLVFAQALTKFAEGKPRYALSAETAKQLALHLEVHT